MNLVTWASIQVKEIIENEYIHGLAKSKDSTSRVATAWARLLNYFQEQKLKSDKINSAKMFVSKIQEVLQKCATDQQPILLKCLFESIDDERKKLESIRSRYTRDEGKYDNLLHLFRNLLLECASLVKNKKLSEYLEFEKQIQTPPIKKVATILMRFYILLRIDYFRRSMKENYFKAYSPLYTDTERTALQNFIFDDTFSKIKVLLNNTASMEKQKEVLIQFVQSTLWEAEDHKRNLGGKVYLFMSELKSELISIKAPMKDKSDQKKTTIRTAAR